MNPKKPYLSNRRRKSPEWMWWKVVSSILNQPCYIKAVSARQALLLAFKGEYYFFDEEIWDLVQPRDRLIPKDWFNLSGWYDFCEQCSDPIHEDPRARPRPARQLLDEAPDEDREVQGVLLTQPVNPLKNCPSYHGH